MSPRNIAVPLVVALLASLLTAGVFRHVQNRKAREAGHLRYENNQLRFQAYQNQQRSPTPAAPDSTLMREASSTPLSQSATSAPAASESYRNLGQATPAAALQTLAWACDRSDTQTVVQMLQLDPSARSKAEACFNSLPEAERTKLKSPEIMLATQITLHVMARPFPSADVLDLAQFETQGEDRAIFHGVRNNGTPFQKVGDTWKLLITEPIFDLLQRTTADVATATGAKP